MGSGCAAETKPSSIEDDEFAIKMIMPVYYTDEVPTSNDIALAADTWNGIYNDVPQRYHDMKQDSKFKQPSCLSWFYVSFYERKKMKARTYVLPLTLFYMIRSFRCSSTFEALVYKHREQPRKIFSDDDILLFESIGQTREI